MGRNSGELQKMQFLGIQSYHLRSAKICIFLRYTHITPFFGVRGTRLNGIIREGWPLGGPFIGPDGPKWPFWGPKVLFLAQNHFSVQILQFFVLPSWQDTKKTKFSCCSWCWASSWWWWRLTRNMERRVEQANLQQQWDLFQKDCPSWPLFWCTVFA